MSVLRRSLRLAADEVFSPAIVYATADSVYGGINVLGSFPGSSLFRQAQAHLSKIFPAANSSDAIAQCSMGMNAQTGMSSPHSRGAASVRQDDQALEVDDDQCGPDPRPGGAAEI